MMYFFLYSPIFLSLVLSFSPINVLELYVSFYKDINWWALCYWHVCLQFYGTQLFKMADKQFCVQLIIKMII